MSARYGIEYGCPRCGRIELVLCPYDRRSPALHRLVPTGWVRHPKAGGKHPRDWYCPDCAPLIVAWEIELRAWQARHDAEIATKYRALYVEDQAWRAANPRPEPPQHEPGDGG